MSKEARIRSLKYGVTIDDVSKKQKQVAVESIVAFIGLIVVSTGAIAGLIWFGMNYGDALETIAKGGMLIGGCGFALLLLGLALRKVYDLILVYVYLDDAQNDEETAMKALLILEKERTLLDRDRDGYVNSRMATPVWLSDNITDINDKISRIQDAARSRKSETQNAIQ